MPPQDAEQAHWFSAHLLPHEDALRAWLQGRYPDADNIDDIIQDSYLRTLRAREAERLHSPKAFLFKTARNLALDHLRSHKISRTISLVDEEVSDVMDSDEAVPEAVCRRQEVAILREALQALPERCRQIVTMHKLQGMPQKEVAQALGISVNTVACQLSIGLRKCTAYVEKYRQEARR